MSADPVPAPAAPLSPGAESAWPLVLILGLAAVLRLPGYFESVWIDELYSSDVFCGDPVILLKTLYGDIHPPAYPVFAHFWNSVFGDTEVSMRLPPMLCGLASIWLIYRLGTEFSGRTGGLIAACLLATSPVHIWYSQEARGYSTNLFLLLLTVLCYLRLIAGRGGISRWLLFLFAMGGAVFTHYYMAVFPCIFVGVALFRKHPNRWRVLLVSCLVLALLGAYAGAKIYLSQLPLSRGYLRPFDLAEFRDLFFTWFLTGGTLTPRNATTALGSAILLLGQAGAAVIIARGAWRLLTSRPTPESPPGGYVLVALLALPGLLLVLTIAGLDATYIERSALPSLPFFFLVLAAGITGWRRPGRGEMLFGATLGFCAVLLAGLYVHRDEWTVYKPNPDWRGAAASLVPELEAAKVPILVYSDYVSPTPLTYYDPRMQEVKNFQRNDDKVRRLLDKAAQVFGKEGFPGADICGYLDQRLAILDQMMRDAEAQTRVRILQLSQYDPMATEPASEGFWLLTHGGVSSRRASGLLENPRLRVVAERGFRSLRLYKLQVRSD